MALPRAAHLVHLGSCLNSQGRLRFAVQSTALASYSKPALTVLGECDGFVRQVAAPLRGAVRRGAPLRRSGQGVHLRPPARPRARGRPASHMQMADGVLPEVTRATGRADFRARCPSRTRGPAWLTQSLPSSLPTLPPVRCTRRRPAGAPMAAPRVRADPKAAVGLRGHPKAAVAAFARAAQRRVAGARMLSCTASRTATACSPLVAARGSSRPPCGSR